MVQEGRQFEFILPKEEQRQINQRDIRKPERLIDQILIQQHLQEKKKKKTTK